MGLHRKKFHILKNIIKTLEDKEQNSNERTLPEKYKHLRELSVDDNIRDLLISKFKK